MEQSRCCCEIPTTTVCTQVVKNVQKIVTLNLRSRLPHVGGDILLPDIFSGLLSLTSVTHIAHDDMYCVLAIYLKISTMGSLNLL